MPPEILVVLGAVGIVALLFLALRFGRMLVYTALALGIVAAIILFALSNWEQARATRKAIQVAQVASVSSVVTSAVLIAVAFIALLAAGVAGYFALRWKLAERGLQQKQLSRPRIALKNLQHLGQADSEVIYVMPDDIGVNVETVDLAEWGW